MNIIITGSLGNISKPLATELIAANHTVTIISSNPEKQAAIEALGAKPLIGSVEDAAFLKQAFAGADAVYTMVPPNFGAPNLRTYMAAVGENYAAAIAANGIQRVVQLSSIGAHLPNGTGPIEGIYDVETTLSKLDGVNITFLRAPFFYNNFYGYLDMIKNVGIMGANYPGNATLIMVDPRDIAHAAAEELQSAATGKHVRYLLSDEYSPAAATAILGAAIGKPDLPWVEFTDEQNFEGLVQAGMPTEMANRFTDMGKAVRSGILWQHFLANRPAEKGAISLEAFAREFAAAYNG